VIIYLEVIGINVISTDNSSSRGANQGSLEKLFNSAMANCRAVTANNVRSDSPKRAIKTDFRQCLEASAKSDTYDTVRRLTEHLDSHREKFWKERRRDRVRVGGLGQRLRDFPQALLHCSFGCLMDRREQTGDMRQPRTGETARGSRDVGGRARGERETSVEVV
jgi:hypothetical protein